jgi:hypothetical protein
MNLLSARIVLRPRAAVDVLDLAAPFCIAAWRVLLPLSGLVLLPTAALCWTAHLLGWPWPAVWWLAVVLGGLSQAPFTIACGELLFNDPRDVRVAAVLKRALRRAPAFAVTYVVTRLTLALALSILIAFPFAVGGLFVAQEALLLEGAGPFAALGRSVRAVRGQGRSVFGVAAALVVLPLAGVAAGEIACQTVVSSVLQLGEPFGTLQASGGTPYALLGFFLTVPLCAAARFLKYTDMRTRKEGWDIQLRFMSIARDSPPAASAEADINKGAA